jgi:hypothetical protein
MISPLNEPVLQRDLEWSYDVGAVFDLRIKVWNNG